MITMYTTINDISHITGTTVIDTSHDYYVHYSKRHVT